MSISVSVDTKTLEMTGKTPSFTKTVKNAERECSVFNAEEKMKDIHSFKFSLDISEKSKKEGLVI